MTKPKPKEPQTAQADGAKTGETLNLHEKLLEIQKECTYLQKESTGNQYSYVGSSQVLGTIRQRMDELKLLLVPLVTNVNVREKEEDKGGGKRTVTYFTEVWMTMTWLDVESGDKLEVPWYAQGVDIAGEKGVGKAYTYGEKYFILKFFHIPTDKDDPDAFQQRFDDDGTKPEKKSEKKTDDKKAEDKKPGRPAGDIVKAEENIKKSKDKAEFEKVKSWLNEHSWRANEVEKIKEWLDDKASILAQGQDL